MATIQQKLVYKVAECDACDAPAVVDEPTRRTSMFGGRWANLCGDCRTVFGLYSSMGYALTTDKRNPNLGKRVTVEVVA